MCPKCGIPHPNLRKNGRANSGKQLLQCKHCGKRFIVDHGQLTNYSHQSQDKYNTLINNTFNGISLKESAKKLKSKHRGMSANKRGISDELACILTGVQRGEAAFLHSYYMSKPSIEDIMNLSEHIDSNSYVWTDGLTSYPKLFIEKL